MKAPGTPPMLLLVPGWGFDGSIWHGLWDGPSGPGACRPVPLDPPGYGGTPLPSGPYHLGTLAEACAAALKGPAFLLGWSLGALAVLELARRLLAAGPRGTASDFPCELLGLILVSATPRFLTGPRWPHGQAPSLLADFARALQQDPAAARRRFLALQVRGCHDPRSALRQLQALDASSTPPHPSALAAGLEILRATDLRPALADITCPALVIHGEGDAVVPPAAGAALAAALPRARLLTLPAAGHVPFLARPQAFRQAVEAFCHAR